MQLTCTGNGSTGWVLLISTQWLPSSPKRTTKFSERPSCTALGPLCKGSSEPCLANINIKKDAKLALQNYFVPKRNMVSERYKFRSREQRPDEPMDSYLTALRELVKSCEFGTLEEEMIRDQIVEKCAGTKEDPIPVNAKKPADEADEKRLICYSCGGLDGHSPNKCGGINWRCNSCKKVGHLARVCKSSQIKEDQKVNRK